MTTLLIITGLLLVLTVLYLLVLRPWHLRWGATDDDLALSLPSDSLVTNPDFNATRGITINSTPDDFGDIVMMSKCMKGIKIRAEKTKIH